MIATDDKLFKTFLADVVVTRDFLTIRSLTHTKSYKKHIR